MTDTQDTDRTRIRMALHKGEERFRQVVESAPNALVMIRDDGRIEMVNAQTERLFGYSRDELLGASAEMLVPRRFRDHHLELHVSLFLKPVSRPMGAGRDLYGLRKDGSEFPIEIGLNPIATDEGTMVLLAVVDISGRKWLEDRFRQIVESAPSAMVMIGPSGLIEMLNAQSETLFGYARDEMLGKPIERLLPERFRSNHPGLRSSYFLNPVSRPMDTGRDLYGLRKDGSEFPIEIGLNPIETEDGTKVLSTIVDISDRKQKEERIEAVLKEKDILLGEIHHRAKNNLEVISSLLDIQIDRVLDPVVVELLRENQNRVRSMALIHQTLYEARNFVQVDFVDFLESIARSLVFSYGVDPNRVALSIDAVGVQLPITAATPCGLIINELISNALKHAFPEGRAGEIRIHLSPDRESRALLSVSDNGKGIPEDFDLASTATFGLQLVHLLTEQLGGTLEIHRANPTEFKLRFPMQRAIT